MKPLISVVSPSWNQGKYLAECLTSCLPENRDEVEHIIVDNLSNDLTLEVLAESPQVRSLIEKDSGQSDALNKGIQMARADWILWLNVDDFLVPGVIQKFLAEIRQGTAYDAIYGHMKLVDENSCKIRTVYQGRWRPWMIRFGIFGLPSTGTLFRKPILLENPISKDYHMIMDSEWCLRTAGKVRALRLDTETVCFRLSEDNKTAAHITTGKLTPRHAEERRKLAAYCPSYGKFGETDRGRAFHLATWCIRKAGRGLILTDKLLSKTRARNAKGN